MPDRTPFEQAALDYCAPRGIPLSVFLGRVVYPGEQQWLEADTIAALEWQVEHRNQCERGHPLAVTGGPGEIDKWNAEVSGHCDLCRALDRAASVVTGKDDLNPLSGAQFRVWRDENTNGHVDHTSAAGRQT